MAAESGDFYLHLISDASLDFFPSNVISEFTTKLPHEVNLPGIWQVALCNIAYQKTWGNISTQNEGTIELKLYQKTPGPKGIFEPKLKVQGVLEPGHYTTIEALTKAIYDKFEGLKIWEASVSHKWTTFRLRDILDIAPQPSNSNKLTFSMKANPYSCHAMTLCLSPNLANLIGFQEFTSATQRNLKIQLALNGGDEIPQTKVLTGIMNLNSGIHSLFCYSGLVRNTIVGDTQVPLLRIVPVRGSDGDYIYETFEDRQYLPVALHRLSTIQVLIGDRLGNKIRFSHGSAPVIMVLHFKRKQ